MPRETVPGATDRDMRRCPRCGETFPCGARLDSCWCDAVTLSDRAREELRTLAFDGCLCAACMRSLG